MPSCRSNTMGKVFLTLFNFIFIKIILARYYYLTFMEEKLRLK